MKQKYFIKRIGEGEDCRVSVIGFKWFKNYKFISFSIGNKCLKIRL